MSAAYSSGELGSTSAPSVASRWRTSSAVERLAQLLVEPLDDRPRRAGRRHQPVAQRRLVAGQAGFRDRRQIGQEARALRAAHRQRPQQAGLGLPMGGRDRGEHHRDMAAEEIGDGRAGALVGNVGELDARHGGEQLAGQMADGADAGRAEVDLARMRLRIGDQLGDRMHRNARMHHQHGGRRCRCGRWRAKSLRGSKPALA